MNAQLRLPPPDRLVPTGDVDALAWYYKPVLGWVMRRRLRWVAELAFVRPADRVLEIGYGSGIFLYELAQHSGRLAAIDVHPHGADVRRRLCADGIRAALVQGDAGALPFQGGCFDVVVIVSALEFVGDAERTVLDAVRVLRPGGRLVCLTPRSLKWADRVLRLLAGVEPEDQFAGGRERARRALSLVLPTAVRARRPRWLLGFAPYEVWVHDV